MKRLWTALILLLPFGAPSAEDIITLATRGGVTQSYLLSAPEAGKAWAVAVLFPGGAGNTDLKGIQLELRNLCASCRAEIPERN